MVSITSSYEKNNSRANLTLNNSQNIDSISNIVKSTNDDTNNNNNNNNHANEKWYTILGQIIIPFFVAGFG